MPDIVSWLCRFECKTSFVNFFNFSGLLLLKYILYYYNYYNTKIKGKTYQLTGQIKHKNNKDTIDNLKEIIQNHQN